MGMIIKSHVEPEKTLHLVCRLKEQPSRMRIDYVENQHFLQVARSRHKKGDIAPAHRHLINKRLILRTHEAWLIIEGKVEASLYDIDDSLITKVKLLAGDCLITLEGGHSFEVLEDCIMYEFKNGPYEGREKDKVLIKQGS